jgi:hypothetical protein
MMPLQLMVEGITQLSQECFLIVILGTKTTKNLLTLIIPRISCIRKIIERLFPLFGVAQDWSDYKLIMKNY